MQLLGCRLKSTISTKTMIVTFAATLATSAATALARPLTRPCRGPITVRTAAATNVGKGMEEQVQVAVLVAKVDVEDSTLVDMVDVVADPKQC